MVHIQDVVLVSQPALLDPFPGLVVAAVAVASGVALALAALPRRDVDREPR